MALLINITITELRYILAVAHELHFGRAAKKCFVSQPTLSIAIAKLESNLGVQIFERSHNKIIITTIGQTILNKAQQIIKTTQDIQLLAEEYKSPLSQPLKIGAIHTVGPYLFPELINQLGNLLSPIKLIIEEDYTQNLHKRLMSGELDVIIVAKPFDYPEINTINLYNEPLDIIIPHNHVWKNKQTINPNELLGETLLLLGKGNCFRDAVLKICPHCITDDQQNQPANTIVTSSLETIKYMVARNMGISIMPRSALKSGANNLYLTKAFITPTPTRQIVLAYRKSFPRPTIINNLVDTIKLGKYY